MGKQFWNGGSTLYGGVTGREDLLTLLTSSFSHICPCRTHYYQFSHIPHFTKEQDKKIISSSVAAFSPDERLLWFCIIGPDYTNSWKEKNLTAIRIVYLPVSIASHIRCCPTTRHEAKQSKAKQSEVKRSETKQKTTTMIRFSPLCAALFSPHLLQTALLLLLVTVITAWCQAFVVSPSAVMSASTGPILQRTSSFVTRPSSFLVSLSMTGFALQAPETEDHARYIIHQVCTCALGGDSSCTIEEA
jgi:hypothetical protein